MSGFFTRANALPVVLVAAMLTITVWWVNCLYHERPWLSYLNVPFEVLVPVVEVGQSVPLRVIRCNADSEPHSYKLARSLENKQTGDTTELGNFLFEQPPVIKSSIATG